MPTHLEHIDALIQRAAQKRRVANDAAIALNRARRTYEAAYSEQAGAESALAIAVKRAVEELPYLDDNDDGD